jgi:CheY-like chemotaxis protein
MENAIGKIIEILLVEDNPGDVDLIKIGLEDAKVLNKLHVVTDGLEAMKFLRGEDIYADAPCPDLILLDLNLPRKSGKEVLQEIKDDPKLQSIPVVILTSSEADEDICRSYELHANCYISKPVDFEQFVKVVQALEHFWFTVVKLPCRNLPPRRS